MLNESKCGRPPPLPFPQHSSPRAGTPRTLLYTGCLVTPLPLLPYPPSSLPRLSPARRLPRASWARGYLAVPAGWPWREILLCGFLPPSLLSVPRPGDLRPGEGAPRGCPRRAFRGVASPLPFPSFPPAPRGSACGAGRGRDPAVGVRSPLLAPHPREAAAGPSWLRARLRRCLRAAPVAAEQLEAGPGLGPF